MSVRCLSSLGIRSASAEKIRQSLRTNIQRVSTSRQKLNILYDTLMNIVQLYQSAENAASESIEGKTLVESTCRRLTRVIQSDEKLKEKLFPDQIKKSKVHKNKNVNHILNLGFVFGVLFSSGG